MPERRARPRAAARPGIEALDDRVLPSSIPHPAHVVVVVEENHAYPAIIGSSQAPYINSLARQGASFTHSYAITHPSQPNYLGLFSGSNQGVTTDAVPTKPFTTPNLGAELLATAHTFGGYSENEPSVGYLGAKSSDGFYVRRHNPWSDWQGASQNAVPSAANMPFTKFPTTNYANLPTVSFVVPNLNNDMHNGTVQAGDTWLKTHINPYVQWAKTHNSLLVVTWDEGDGSTTNQIATLFVGPMVKPGNYAESITHYNVLRTIEDMYGLGYAGASSTAAPITDIWA
jgi:hypothetical protein